MEVANDSYSVKCRDEPKTLSVQRKGLQNDLGFVPAIMKQNYRLGKDNDTISRREKKSSA